MKSIFNIGDKVITVMSAIPINMRKQADIGFCTLPQGGVYSISKIIGELNNTSVIEVQLNDDRKPLLPRYWASCFQLYEANTDTFVYYKL